MIFLLLTSAACQRSKTEQTEPTPTPTSAAAPPATSAAAPGSPEPSQQAAEPTAENASFRVIGGPQLLAELKTKKVRGTLVNVWASWCGPCRQEFPMLTALRSNLAPQGIPIVFVSVDEAEAYGVALEFATQFGEQPPLLVAERPLGPFKAALNPNWPGMLPATFLFDGEGNLRYFWGGPVYENELLPIIEGFLRGEDINGEARPSLSRGLDLR